MRCSWRLSGTAMAVLFAVAPRVSTKVATGETMLDRLEPTSRFARPSTPRKARSLKGAPALLITPPGKQPRPVVIEDRLALGEQQPEREQAR